MDSGGVLDKPLLELRKGLLGICRKIEKLICYWNISSADNYIQEFLFVFGNGKDAAHSLLNELFGRRSSKPINLSSKEILSLYTVNSNMIGMYECFEIFAKLTINPALWSMLQGVLHNYLGKLKAVVDKMEEELSYLFKSYDNWKELEDIKGMLHGRIIKESKDKSLLLGTLIIIR